MTRTWLEPRPGRLTAAAVVAATVSTLATPAWSQTLLVTALTVEEAAWSASTGRLYAVLPPGVGGAESSVVELHPDTGAIAIRAPIPAGPNGGATRLAVSDDGSALYVGVDGGRRIRRYALPALTPGVEFSLGVGQGGAPQTARDLAVVPGSTGTVVVAQTAAGTPAEFVVYDDGSPRPDRGYGLTPAFLSPTRLIDLQGFQRYRLTGTGLTADTPAAERLATPIATIDDGVAYNVTGDVYDLLARRVRGHCRAQGAVVPAPDLDRLLYFGLGAVTSCAPSSFTVTGQLPVSSGSYRKAMRTGRGRAALVEASGRLVIAQGVDAVLPPAPVEPAGMPWPVGIEPDVVATLTGCTTCRAGDVFRLVATASVVPRAVEVKGAIILPNGAAVAVTALGVSHLVLRNLYPPASATILEAVLPPGLPAGHWLAELALLDPDTGAVWSRSTVAFEVQP